MMDDHRITSKTHPFVVDFLPSVGVSGTIGICGVPGRKSGKGNDEWDRDMSADLKRLQQTYFTSMLACLMEWQELASVGAGGLFNQAAQHQIDVRWFPVQDHETSVSREAYNAFVSVLARHARAGGRLVIHCKGGRGRAPTTAACVLLKLGYSAEDAISLVRGTRLGALTNYKQIKYISYFDEYIKGL